MIVNTSKHESTALNKRELGGKQGERGNKSKTSEWKLIRVQTHTDKYERNFLISSHFLMTFLSL